METIKSSALEALYAKIQARKAAKAATEKENSQETTPIIPNDQEPISGLETPGLKSLDKYGNEILLNEGQTEFVTAISNGESVVLIGAAGTGKTTAMRAATESLIKSGRVPPISDFGHKHLHAGTPGIAITAYTRRAVNNIRKNVSEDLAANCITNHKFLEFEPVIYEIFDEKTGEMRKTMKFAPARHRYNPIS